MKIQDVKEYPRKGFGYYRRTEKDIESGQKMRHWCRRYFYTRDDVFLLPNYLATNALKWEFLEEYVLEKEKAEPEKKVEKKKEVKKNINKKKKTK